MLFGYTQRYSATRGTIMQDAAGNIDLKSRQLATQLLEAQVAFVREQLSGANATQTFAEIIDFALDHAQHIQLQDAIRPEHVKEAIQVYAFDLNLGGGIMELIGATAQKVYTEAARQSQSLAEILGSTHVEQWIDKVLELEQLRLHIIDVLQNSPAAQQVATNMVASVIKARLPSWEPKLHQSWSWPAWFKRVPLAESLGQTLARQEDRVLHAVERVASYLLRQQGTQVLRLDSQTLKEVAMDVWQHIKDVPLNELITGLSALDIEEFFVLIYELWRDMRQTDYIQHLVLTGADVFFEIYGHYPVADLLSEIGINKTHLTNDANRFLPPFIHMLNERHILDQLVRLQLGRFYEQDSTLALIRQHLN
jgi:hypothetical protein